MDPSPSCQALCCLVFLLLYKKGSLARKPLDHNIASGRCNVTHALRHALRHGGVMYMLQLFIWEPWYYVTVPW